MSRVYWTSILFGLGLAGAAAADDLLDEAASGHRQLRESLRSVHVKHRIETLSQSFPIRRDGEWLQLDASIRWRERTKNGRKKDAAKGDKESWIEAVVAKGRHTLVGRREDEKGQPQVGASISVPDGDEAGFFNPWARANFVVQDKPPLTLLDILESASWKKTVKEDVGTRRRLIHVIASNENGQHIQAWLSPDEGYVVRRLVVSKGPFSETNGHIEFVIDEMQKTAGRRQIDFPLRTTMSIYNKGERDRQPFIQSKTVFESVEVDPVFPDGTFTPPSIPHGAVVVNWINRTEYRSRPDGEPIDPNKVTPLLPAPPAQQPQPSTTSYWPAILGVAGLFVAIALAYWRWRRSRDAA